MLRSFSGEFMGPLLVCKVMHLLWKIHGPITSESRPKTWPPFCYWSLKNPSFFSSGSLMLSFSWETENSQACRKFQLTYHTVGFSPVFSQKRKFSESNLRSKCSIVDWIRYWAVWMVLSWTKSVSKLIKKCKKINSRKWDKNQMKSNSV